MTCLKYNTRTYQNMNVRFFSVRWRQYVPQKFLPTSSRGVTTQNTNINTSKVCISLNGLQLMW